MWCPADSPLTLSRTAGVKQGPLHENQMHLNSSVAQPRPAKCGYFHAPTPRHVITGMTKVLLLCDSVMQSSCFLSMVIIKQTMTETMSSSTECLPGPQRAWPDHRRAEVGIPSLGCRLVCPLTYLLSPPKCLTGISLLIASWEKS